MVDSVVDLNQSRRKIDSKRSRYADQFFEGAEVVNISEANRRSRYETQSPAQANAEARAQDAALSGNGSDWIYADDYGRTNQNERELSADAVVDIVAAPGDWLSNQGQRIVFMFGGLAMIVLGFVILSLPAASKGLQAWATYEGGRVARTARKSGLDLSTGEGKGKGPSPAPLAPPNLFPDGGAIKEGRPDFGGDIIDAEPIVIRDAPPLRGAERRKEAMQKAPAREPLFRYPETKKAKKPINKKVKAPSPKPSPSVPGGKPSGNERRAGPLPPSGKDPNVPFGDYYD